MEADLSQFQWDTVTLRMTAFPAPGSEISASEWWEMVVGDPPELRTEKPRTNEIDMQTTRGSGKLELQINPLSLTWVHHTADLQTEKGIVSLGQFQNMCEEFCELVNEWFDLESVPNFVRLAFGSILIQSVNGQEEAIARLSKYIPAVSLDPAPSSSFLYQINRRRDSNLGLSGLAINRVMKWSLAQQMILITHSDGRTDFAPFMPKSYVHLEIDINTVPEYEGVFEKDYVPRIFSELVELGTEIAVKGDIP